METRESMRTLEAYGTVWPLPAAWNQTEPGVFEGEEGMFKVFLDDNGDLIDPGRCERAESTQPAGWSLVRTRNGVSVAGSYVRSGVRVLIYCLRPDVRDLPAATYEMPEVQVTYVFTNAASDEFVRCVKDLVDEQNVEPREYGQLDAYGHSAMGPVPLLRSWVHVDETVRQPNKPNQSDDAHLVLVGGGYVTFADVHRCCGMGLRPMAWRTYDAARVNEQLTSEVAQKGLTIEIAPQARVWKCAIDRRGVSYTARDPSGRVASLGAVWTDAFGQTWRLHYWFHPEHGRQPERVLSGCCKVA
jgi:hypothetical protein